MPNSGGRRLEPASVAEWHDWLAAHHDSGDGVWVAVPRRSGDGFGYEELVCEALCWGWIDGQARPLDGARYLQWFTRRKPNSPWAASNKARVADLERQGRLQPPGIAEIERAKANGMWTVFDSVEALLEPAELAAALDAEPTARATWVGYPNSVKKQALAAIALARRAETRTARIASLVAKAARGERPA